MCGNNSSGDYFETKVGRQHGQWEDNNRVTAEGDGHQGTKNEFTARNNVKNARKIKLVETN